MSSSKLTEGTTAAWEAIHTNSDMSERFISLCISAHLRTNFNYLLSLAAPDDFIDRENQRIHALVSMLLSFCDRGETLSQSCDPFTRGDLAARESVEIVLHVGPRVDDIFEDALDA